MYTELCIQHPVNTFTLGKKKKKTGKGSCMRYEKIYKIFIMQA